MTETTPVTILSGTLGAGKTTTLNHVLTHTDAEDVAVLVNDVGEVNVDAEVVGRRVEEDSELVELSNGCICCGIRSDFESAILELAREESVEYLLVEPSGISEPAPVAQQFEQGLAAGSYDLSSVVTVVDARQFFDAFGEGTAERRGEADDRPLSDLLVEGVEFCDTIVLNKTDLVTDEELTAIRETIRTLQPHARLLETSFGAVDPGELLGTGRFDVEEVSQGASWRRAMDHHREHGDSGGEDHTDHDDDNGARHEDDSHAHHDQADHTHHDDDEHGDDHTHHDHAHPPEVYGIDSFVFERREPLHPGRLVEAIRGLPEEVVRVKGYLHVAGRPETALVLSFAGVESHVEVAGRWVASLPEDHREAFRRRRDLDWHEEYGDRKTELVIIGRDVDRETVLERFEACVLGDGEQVGAENPFPAADGESFVLRATGG